jgi:Xaa-Pro aminopeptidase
MDSVAQSLLKAQGTAEALFDAVVSSGMIQPGKLESEVSDGIHSLAKTRFGLRRHWHRRIVRSGPNALLGYHDDPPDRRITDDDLLYLDFGPVFEEWEADFGRSYVVGSDPVKHRLVADLWTGFQKGRDFFNQRPDVTAGELYDYVVDFAKSAGWEFGAATAGHLVGHFPHETEKGPNKRFSIRHGNQQSLRERDASGAVRHWILEIHLVDRERQIGGFLEQLLTA